MKDFEADELIVMIDDGFKVKDMDRLRIRYIAMNFDRDIERKENKAKYSRTV